VVTRLPKQHNRNKIIGKKTLQINRSTKIQLYIEHIYQKTQQKEQIYKKKKKNPANRIDLQKKPPRLLQKSVNALNGGLMVLTTRWAVDLSAEEKDEEEMKKTIKNK
jgi:hypothetical protein